MEVRQSKNGYGLFATKKYNKDEVVHVLDGIQYTEPTRESIHVGNNEHIHDSYGMYINHSFCPNIYVNGHHLVALCNILIDDEILFNYNDTEINMANPFYDDGILVCGHSAS
jgi:hypothetical protein